MQVSIDGDQQELNFGHSVEAMDRCWNLLDCVQRQLKGHPMIIACELSGEVEEIEKSLFDLYQKIGNESDRVFGNEMD